MAAEIKQNGAITIKGRREMILEGVREVVDFDEVSLHARTVDGELFVEGCGIRIGVLDTERGLVTLIGEITALYYSEGESEKKGFFKRMLR